MGGLQLLMTHLVFFGMLKNIMSVTLAAKDNKYFVLFWFFFFIIQLKELIDSQI